MNARKPISTRLRFDTFKRDKFSCQYCGAHPPQAILHIDHIKPIAEGGDNCPDNLVTACDNCNLGKGAVPLGITPQSLEEKARDVAEREKQVRGYSEVMEAKRQRLEDEMWIVADIFNRDSSTTGLRRDWLLSIKRFIERIGFHEVIDAMEISTAKMPWGNKSSFSYFCGVYWNKIREQEKNG